MKSLLELVDLVTRYKRRQIEILGYHEKATSNYESFYDLIAKGKIRTDDEAAAKLFGKGKTAKYKEYLNFKANFLRRLVNAVFFIDLKKPEFNKAQQAWVSCWKNLAAVKIMQGRGARNAAIELSVKTIAAAQKYEYMELVLELAKVLKNYYAAQEGNRKLWEKYDRLAHESNQIMTATLRAQSMLEELILPYVRSRAHNPETTKRAKIFLRELEPLVKRHKAWELHYYYFLIASVDRQTAHDYPGTAEICRRAIQYFESKPNTPIGPRALFYQPLIVSLTMMGKYEEAEQFAQNAEKLVALGSLSWYKGREQHLILQLYRRDYSAAWNIFHRASHNKGYRLLPDMEKESWKIYEAMMHLLIRGKKLPSVGDKNLKISRFLNEVPEFAKDKRGMNIPVLILHTLFLLFEGDFEKAESRIRALEKYAARHLHESDDTFRTSCFLQALLQIPKSGFQPQQAAQSAESWLRRMSTVPVMFAGSPHEVEVVPYEHLWEWAMEALETRGEEEVVEDS